MFEWKDGRRRQELPIDGYLGEIINLVKNNQVVVLEAATGAGKTIRTGQAVILELDWPVKLTQTRRNAVRWNGRRIAYELGCWPGEIVGWRLFGEEPVVSSRTRLELVIDQSLANTIRRAGGKLPKGLIIGDEAHERGIPTDLLLGLIKESLPESPETHILITSATIDTKKFSEFFGGAPVISVPGRCFPVRTEVIKTLYEEHHTQGAQRAAEVVIERFLKGELKVPAAEGEGEQVVQKGAVIVLLPGKDDIDSVKATVEAVAKKLKAEERVQALECHGESSSEEQDAVQTPVPEGTIRFVCGTEILRSSVTVQDTVGVIDSLQIKRPISDARGITHLTKIAISRAEADQGKGRAGRTQPGFYMPVSYDNEYEKLKPYPTPAILQQPITSAALQVAQIGRSIRNFSFIDVPPKDKVDVAIERLQRLGALDKEEKITEIGELLVQFPVDPERAKALVTADKLGVLAEAVVAVAIIENEGIFHRPEPEKKLVLDEATVRLLLSRCEKDRWDDWTIRETPLALAEVDLTNLPEWVKKVEFDSNENGEGANKNENGEKESSEQKKRERKLVDTGVAYYEVDSSWLPHREKARWVADLLRKQWAGESGSDFAASVRAYRAFKAEERRLKELKIRGRNKGNALRDWCFSHFLNEKRLRMSEFTMQQIREDLQNSPLLLQNGLAQECEFAEEALTKALASGHIDLVMKRTSGRSYQGRIGEVDLAYQSACPSDELILIGGARKVPVQRRRSTDFVNLADLAAPLKTEWLVEIMPQLCSFKRHGDLSYDKDSDQVSETESVFFVDVEVAKRQVLMENRVEATKVFGEWLARTNLSQTPLAEVEKCNSAIRTQARELNSRAGEIAFEIEKPEAYIQWLQKQLNGACAMKEIANVDILRLPALDAEFVQLVMAGNPETVQVDEQALKVSYGRTGYGDAFYARLEVSEELARRASIEKVTLPGGRDCELLCAAYGQQHSAKSFLELVQKLETARIAGDWTKAREKHEKSSTSRTSEIYELFAQVGESVVVSYDSAGEIISGWKGLSKVSWSAGNFRIKLFSSAKEAEEETLKGLRELVLIGTEGILEVPQEAPYQEYSSGWYSSGWKLTELGEALKLKFAAIKQEIENLVGLTVENVRAKIEEVKAQAEAAKTEIAGRYLTVQKAIAEAEAAVKNAIAGTGENREFVADELDQAEKALDKAKANLKKLAYAEAEQAASQAAQAVIGLTETAKARAEAKEKAEAARNEVSDDIYIIQSGKWADGEFECTEQEMAQAQELAEAISGAWHGKRFDEVLVQVEKARLLIARVQERVKNLVETQRVLAFHIKSAYTTTPFYTDREVEPDQYIPLVAGNPLFPGLYREIQEQADRAGDGRVRLMESTLAGQPVVWLEALIYNQDEIDLYVRIFQDVVVKESDLERIRVFDLWTPPNEEEAKLWLELEQLEGDLEKLEREISDCEGDYPSRVLLKFELDRERSTLFCITSVPEISVETSQGYDTVKGQVRFTCDPKRVKWLDTPPVAGEQWVCSLGRMIGRDKKGRPVVIANPQIKNDRAAIEKAIAQVEVRLGGGDVDTPEESDIAVAQTNSGEVSALGAALLNALNKK